MNTIQNRYNIIYVQPVCVYVCSFAGNMHDMVVAEHAVICFTVYIYCMLVEHTAHLYILYVYYSGIIAVAIVMYICPYTCT